MKTAKKLAKQELEQTNPSTNDSQQAYQESEKIN